jgi:hypothetical protein
MRLEVRLPTRGFGGMGSFNDLLVPTDDTDVRSGN